MLDHWLGRVGIREKRLWQMSWLELDAKCHNHSLQSWDRWDHTRSVIGAFLNKTPQQVVLLPTDTASKSTSVLPPPPEFFEEARIAANKLLSTP